MKDKNKIKKKKKKIKGPVSQNMEFWYRMNRNKMAMTSLYIIILTTILAFFAPFIAPYHYDYQNTDAILEFPSSQHWFGTDNFGRDILSRIIYGSRISMLVGFVSVIIALIVGCALGTLAAFFTKLDNPIMRFMDILAGIPPLILSISIISAMGNGLLNLMIAVSISTIPSYARVMRAAVMTEINKEYVEAATSIGVNKWGIIMRHIMPNCLSPILVQATLGVASSILAISSLSYLGLGIQPPTPEWGAMLSAGRNYIRNYWHMTVIPGMAIMIVVYSINIFGDNLRDALDPRLKN